MVEEAEATTDAKVRGAVAKLESSKKAMDEEVQERLREVEVEEAPKVKREEERLKIEEEGVVAKEDAKVREAENDEQRLERTAATTLKVLEVQPSAVAARDSP
eukprot:TRINITY_DN1749_c0_g1_i1.p2 TRINITY_DN1749_c0_g1~~TRINITY_DN1749_c0_g1_i1.p2  ORF type:complete len:103 (+),score=55.21 TRINITY_DN1749_c0_g1_i1:168-476(+)